MSEENIGEQFKGIAGKSLLKDAQTNLRTIKNIDFYPTGANVKGLIDADYYLSRAISSHNVNNWTNAVGWATVSAQHLMKQVKEHNDDRFGTSILDKLSPEDASKYANHLVQFHNNIDNYVKLYGEGLTK